MVIEIKRCLILGRKAMTNVDSILKSRDIALLTKVHLVKVVVFPIVMYGCVHRYAALAVQQEQTKWPMHVLLSQDVLKSWPSYPPSYG